MSRLRQPNGDDYPDAARRHVQDSAALLAADRPDGSAYLAGYAAECALKTLLVLETGSAARTHELADLHRQVAELAVQGDAATSRYCGTVEHLLRRAAILDWAPAMRYRPEEMPRTLAEVWQREAAELYTEVVAALVFEGRL